jgi:hypothetical protein
MVRPAPLLLLLSLVVGCPKQETEGKKSSASSEEKPAAKSSDDDEPAAKAKPKKKPKPAASAPKPLDNKEKSALAEYQTALKKGRKLTLAKDFDGAIAAFDDALKAQPDDPRALSERGYAKLLAKKWEPAREDLLKAQRRTADRVLQAQIWYNLGLVEEGKGDAAAAQQAFAQSNTLNPTNAAKKKLEGKSACAAVIDTSGSDKATAYASWKALYDALAKSYEADIGIIDDKPKDEAGAKQSLCEESGGCKGDGPFVIWIGVPWVTMRWTVVKRNSEGKLLAFAANDAGMGGRCTWRPDVAIASQDGLVHVVQLGEPQLPELLGPKGGDCNGDEPEGCQTACANRTWEQADLVYDFDAKVRVVRVDQNAAYAKGEAMGAAGKAPTKISVKGKTVTLAGGGCDREIK